MNVGNTKRKNNAASKLSVLAHASMTPNERKERARKAAAARWSKNNIPFGVCECAADALMREELKRERSAKADLLVACKALMDDLQEAYDRNPEATAEWISEIAPETYGQSKRLVKAAIAKAEGR